MAKFHPESEVKSKEDVSSTDTPPKIQPILLDRVILTTQSKDHQLWIALTDDKRILLVDANGQSFASLDLANLLKVKGMGSKLRFYTLSGPTYLQFLPVLRDPNIGPKNMYGAGAAGNLYLENKYERLSNVYLWINTLKEYGIEVKYWKTSVAIPLMIVGSFLGILALAGLSILVTFVVGFSHAIFR